MNEGQRYRVRPWIRTVAIVTFVFLLPFATYATWDYIEARRLSGVIEAIRARGETVFWSTWQAQVPSPEQKLAGRYYSAAAIFARDAYASKFREINDTIAAIAMSDPRAAARDPRLDQLQRVLDEYAPTLDLLDRADALATSEIRGDDLRYRVPDQNVANINAVRIARLSLLGNAPSAVTAVSQTLKLHRVPSLWPIGIDTIPSLRLLLTFAPPDAASLARLQEKYAAMVDEDQVEKDLIETRARFITGLWPAASGPMVVVPRLNGLRGMRAPFIEVIFRPWLTRGVRRRIVEYEEVLPIAREPWPKKLDMALALAEKYPNSPPSQTGLFARLVPGVAPVPLVNLAALDVSRFAKRTAVDLARQRVAITALAIERFRRAHASELPPDLNALVPQYLEAVPTDPYSGAPLKFTRSDRGYRVYSVGSNRTDEGGDWSNEAPRKTASPTAALLVPKDIGIDIRKF